MYAESLLVPFKRFLQASFSRCHNNNLATTDLTLCKAPEECALRSLLKDEPEGYGEVSDEEWKLKNIEAGDDANGEDKTTLSKGISEYKISRVKNITKLKLELAKLDEQYLFPDELQQKSAMKKSAKKKSKALVPTTFMIKPRQLPAQSFESGQVKL